MITRLPSHLWLIGAACGLSGCVVTPLSEEDLDQPMFGRDEVTAVHLSPSQPLRLSDVVAVAKVIRTRRTLQDAERDLIALALRRKFDALVSIELVRLRALHEPQRKAIAAMPDRAAAARAARLLDEAERREAVASILKAWDKVAVVVRSPSEPPSVTFGRLSAEGAHVARSTFDLDVPAASLPKDARITIPGSIDPDALAPIGIGRRTSTAALLDMAPVVLPR